MMLMMLRNDGLVAWLRDACAILPWSRLLLQQHYGVEPPPLGAWGLTIAASPALSHGLAAATLGVELAFPWTAGAGTTAAAVA